MSSGMKTILLLFQIRPRCFARWRSLPIFGPFLDDFLQWMQDQNYTRGTTVHYMDVLPKVVAWLRRHRITRLPQLTQKDLQAAHDDYRLKQEGASLVVGALKRFLSDRQLVPEGDWPPPSPVKLEACPKRPSHVTAERFEHSCCSSALMARRLAYGNFSPAKLKPFCGS